MSLRTKLHTWGEAKFHELWSRCWVG